MNRRMPVEKRNRFRQVDNRVQNCGIGLQLLFHREIGDEIHKSLECEDSIGTVVNCRNMFGRYAALETFGAQFPSSGIVAESNREILPAFDCIVHLSAIAESHIRVDSSRREIADQCRMTERDIGKQAEHGNGRQNRRRHGSGYRCSFTAAEEPEGLREIAPFQSHHEVDNRTARTQPEVIP